MANPIIKRKLKVAPFALKDCALLAISTGRTAQNLRELASHIEQVHPESIYYHFWGNRLRPRFEPPEFQNDFATWARHALADHPLSERLGIIDPTKFSGLEELREEVLDVIEERLAESDYICWATGDREFSFIRSQIVVFDTGIRASTPEELGEMMPGLTVSSIFYHFIDGRRRVPDGVDDFRAWLKDWDKGYVTLIDALASVDPYFVTLTELRERLVKVFDKHLHTEQ
jgi:hypothetical protein